MNQKKQRTLAIFALSIALLATSIAYAALSATLKISGSVVRKGLTWDVHLANPTTPITTGTGKMTIAPKIDGTKLTFTSELSKPGDSVEFNFDIVNGGDIDALLAFFYGSLNEKSFSSSSEIKISQLTSEDITCSVLYKGKLLSYYSEDMKKYGAIDPGDLSVAKGESKTVTVKCLYNESATTVSEKDEEFKFVVDFDYNQLGY